MKLIVAVVQDRDTQPLLERLTAAGHRTTRLASSGGFLQLGNVTLMIGTEDSQVDEVVALIKESCRAREHLMAASPVVGGEGQAFTGVPTAVSVGGATVFVMDVDRFEK